MIEPEFYGVYRVKITYVSGMRATTTAVFCGEYEGLPLWSIKDPYQELPLGAATDVKVLEFLHWESELGGPVIPIPAR